MYKYLKDAFTLSESERKRDVGLVILSDENYQRKFSLSLSRALSVTVA